MTKEMFMRLHRIFNILVAVFTVIAGAFLMAGCLVIYYKNGEYSREIVGEVFRAFSVPVYICLALVIVGFIYEFISPLKAKKEKPERDHAFLREKLSAKKNFAECDKTIVSAIVKERKVRVVIAVIRAALIVVCACIFLYYGADPDNFGTEITDSMIGAMKWLAPCLFVSGGFAVFAAYYNNSSIKRETELLKKLPDARGEGLSFKKETKAKSVIFAVLKVVIVAVAVAALVYGAVEGGFADVMTKAVNICTECIGLG
ncbi:MAG: hypothetical protein IJF69_03360 [Clostridia bacterium]|nr:hypothetical protein [Clostridia bacterium]